MRQRRQPYVAVAGELKRRAQRVRPWAHRGHLTDAEHWVSPRVWQELKSTVDEVPEGLHRAARPPRAPGAIFVSATLVMLEMAPHFLESEPAKSGRSR
jgi:hypothetical protein